MRASVVYSILYIFAGIVGIFYLYDFYDIIVIYKMSRNSEPIEISSLIKARDADSLRICLESYMDYYTTKLVSRPDAEKYISHIVTSRAFLPSDYAKMARTVLASKRKTELIIAMFDPTRIPLWCIAFVKDWTPAKDWGVRSIFHNYTGGYALPMVMFTCMIRKHGDTFLAHYTHLPGKVIKEEWKSLFCVEFVVATIYGVGRDEVAFQKTMEKVLMMGHMLTKHEHPERYQYRYLYMKALGSNGGMLFRTSTEMVDFLNENWGSEGTLRKNAPPEVDGVSVDNRIRVIKEILEDPEICAMAPNEESLNASRNPHHTTTEDDEEVLEEVAFVGGRVIMYRDDLGDIFNWKTEHNIADEYENPEKELPKIRREQVGIVRSIKERLSDIRDYIVCVREMAGLSVLSTEIIEGTIRSERALDYVPEDAEEDLKRDLIKLKALEYRRDENQKRIDDFIKRIGTPALSDLPERPKTKVVKQILPVDEVVRPKKVTTVKSKKLVTNSEEEIESDEEEAPTVKKQKPKKQESDEEEAPMVKKQKPKASKKQESDEGEEISVKKQEAESDEEEIPKKKTRAATGLLELDEPVQKTVTKVITVASKKRTDGKPKPTTRKPQTVVDSD